MQIQGFLASAVEAGIRYPNKLDLGLIVSEQPAVAAGVFTQNRVQAAPVRIDIERLRSGQMRALLLNSGIANACTGKQGMEAALTCGKMTANILNIPEEMVLLASTGVIGEQLDTDCIRRAAPD